MASRVVSVDFTTAGAGKVTAALSEVETAAKRSSTNTAAAVTKANTSVDLSSKNLAKSLSSLKGGVGSSVQGFAALGGSSVLGAAAAIAGVGFAVKSLVDAGRNMAQAERVTSAAIISTGGAANVSTDQIHQLSSSLSILTGVQATTIESADNVLLRFTNVRNEAGKNNDIFTQATKSALDLSVGLGRDLTSSALILGKALQDPVKGMTQLRRAGIVLSTEQQDQIKTFVKAGDTLSAQKVILDQLKTSYGGTAAAAADPLSKLDAQVVQLKENLGTGLIPILNAAIGPLSKFVSALSGAGGGKHSFFGDSSTVGQGLSGALDFFTGKGELGLIGKLFGGGGGSDANTKALKDLDSAQQQLNKDAAAAHPSQAQLAKDADAVHAAQAKVDAITRLVSGALGDNAAAANGAAGAYAYLGDAASSASIKTASAAANAVVSSITSAGSSPYQLQLDKNAAQASADALHGKIDSGGSGGGSGQTAAALALDQTQKQLTLRDALRAVATTATAVTSAQLSLKQAQESSIQAAEALTAAEKNYQITLHGVAAGSLAAKQAHEALTSAQDQAKSSALNLIDAQRALKDAQTAAANAPHLAQEGAQGAGLGLQSAQLNLKDAQAALARARETQDPETIQRAQIALGEAQLQVAQATDANTAAQKQLGEVGKKNSVENENVKKAQIGVTDAQIAATQAAQALKDQTKLTNEILHGYAAGSLEAQQATNDLTNAQIGAQQASLGVTQAQQGLVAAQDQVATTALAARRAQLDLQGALTNSGSAAGKAATKSGQLITALDDLRTKSIAVATDIEQAVVKATGSPLQGFQAMVGSLRAAVDAEPLLVGAFDPILAALQTEITLAFTKVNSATNPLGTYGPDKGPGGRAAHAAGGFAPAGQTFTSGEAGYEIMHARLGGGVDILSNPQSRHALWSGAGTQNTYYITIHAADGDDVVRKIQEWERRNARPVSARKS